MLYRVECNYFAMVQIELRHTGFQEMKTFRICEASKTSEVVGSLTKSGPNPTLALISSSRSRPYILPFGNTIGSFSTLLLVWCAYGRFRASSFSSVEQMGQTVVVEELAFAVLLAYFEWQDGVLSTERPAERAMCRSGRAGSEKRSWCVFTKRFAR